MVENRFKNWRRSDFKFELPESLIAQHPAAARQDSRLLVCDPRCDSHEVSLSDCQFVDFPALLQPGDLMVMNNTRVIPARLLGQKASGGKVEVLIERLLSDDEALVHVRASKSPRPDTMLLLESVLKAEVLGRDGDLFRLRFELPDSQTLLEVLEQYGHMPLPPYITRSDTAPDWERYQTVYAEQSGAVAAPTAGLHFTHELLAQIKDKGIDVASVTLHVGAGTFQPVREEGLSRHPMHSEWMQLDEQVVQQVQATWQRGGRVIAVGTTSVRCLETAVQGGVLQAFTGDTDIFITPGYDFKVVDALLTNFHLSESTLIMLVSAFAGYDNIRQAYQHAIKQRYRFFSYGDAMFITHRFAG